jgi:hypothetical protein
MEWKYDLRIDAFVTGASHDGCGVYLDFEPDQYGWFANVMHRSGALQIFGPYLTKEKAQETAEEEYKRIDAMDQK